MSQQDIEEKERKGRLQKKRTRKDKRTKEKGTPDYSAQHKHVAMVKDTHRMPVETTANIDE